MFFCLGDSLCCVGQPVHREKGGQLCWEATVQPLGRARIPAGLWQPSAEVLFPAVSRFPAALTVFSTDLDMLFSGSFTTCFLNIFSLWACQGILRRPVSPFFPEQTPPTPQPAEMHFLVPTVPLSPCLWINTLQPHWEMPFAAWLILGRRVGGRVFEVCSKMNQGNRTGCNKISKCSCKTCWAKSLWGAEAGLQGSAGEADMKDLYFQKQESLLPTLTFICSF